MHAETPWLIALETHPRRPPPPHFLVTRGPMAPKRVTPATSPTTMRKLLKGSGVPVPGALLAEGAFEAYNFAVCK